MKARPANGQGRGAPVLADGLIRDDSCTGPRAVRPKRAREKGVRARAWRSDRVRFSLQRSAQHSAAPHWQPVVVAASGVSLIALSAICCRK